MQALLTVPFVFSISPARSSCSAMPTGEEDNLFPLQNRQLARMLFARLLGAGRSTFLAQKPFGLSVKFTGRLPPCRPAASAEIFRPFFFPSA
nr:hypothetical protein [Bacillaceae bacterium]